ncbi:DUF692 domain-containing protein [Moraxella nasovis]|uniref:HvfB family MNIO-type RiPP peptide maturase n=1 Tax=Moraxella nasovis TaxID=2904121 RepID=UPI001F62192F|nr:DUF692 domain-containing protein [Moraxella nasovis]UNU73991.1 DUF692 domain-containing protein [Moraxella nasovis]
MTTISDISNVPTKTAQTTPATQLPTPKAPTGAGLGFRRELIDELNQAQPLGIDFFEVSPENWLTGKGAIDGAYHKQLRAFTERFDFVCHGLSLSIGGIQSLDVELLNNIKRFMKSHDMSLYTEHLSWCSDDWGHLYDLLPIPCTEEAVKWVAGRIKQAQDIMGQKIGFENASYYFRPTQSTLSDAEFISAVCAEADCLLHLDINNIYVNSKNFGFDPHAYLRSLPLERTCYLHMAGHFTEEDGFIVDTHGNQVVEEVWALLADAYELIGQKTGKPASSLPTCLERDFNFPALDELMGEVARIRQYQNHSSQYHQKKHDTEEPLMLSA